MKTLKTASIISALALASSNAMALDINYVNVLSKPGEPFRAEVSVVNQSVIDTNDLQVRMVPLSTDANLKSLAKSITVGSFGQRNSNTLILEVSSPFATPAQANQLIANVKLANAVASHTFKVNQKGPQLNPNVTTTLSPAMDITQSNSSLNLASTEQPLIASTDLPPEMPLVPSSAMPPAMDASSTKSYNQVTPVLSTGTASTATVATTKPTASTEPRTTQQTTPQATPATTTDNSTTAKLEQSKVKVVKGESLWLIATRIANDSNISTQRAMANIYASNPDAFVNNNPNLIKANAQVVIRDAEQLSTAERKRAEHFLSGDAFNRSRNTNKAATLAKSKPKKSNTAHKPTPAIATPTTQEDQLVLVSPTNSGSSTGNTTNTVKGGNGSAYSQKLVKQREQVKSARSKVRALAEVVTGNDNKLTLLNDQIAELQKQLEAKRKLASNKG